MIANTRNLIVLLLISSIIFCSGCATMFGDSQDLLMINSAVPSAEISVNGNKIGNGSVQYALPRQGDTVVITASKKGCNDRSVQTSKKTVGATWLNILFWPGFIIDVATGAMFKANPTFYTVTPDCGAAS